MRRWLRSRVFWRRTLLAVSGIWLGAVVTERVLDTVFPYPTQALLRYGESRRITDREGRLLRLTLTPRQERLVRVALPEVSPALIEAVVAGEDGRFFEHSGVDVFAVVRAAFTSLQRGRVISGASTLSMQVARLAEPHPRTLPWKIVEMFRARQLERLMTKEQILEHYLNMVPLGGTLRGVGAAAERWFGKPASELTALESAMFVAMFPAPGRRSPLTGAGELLRWRNEILRRMHHDGYLRQDQLARYLKEPLHAQFHQWDFRAPHFVDAEGDPGGPAVQATTLSLPLQSLVERELRARPDRPVDGVAVVVLDRRDGRTLALAGSDDYRRKPFNATRARRAAASTLKPFLYARAIERGCLELTGRVDDVPGDFSGYRPRNFTRDFLGPMRADDALTTSRNLPAVRLLQQVGVEDFLAMLVRLGLSRPGESAPVGLDLALGTLAVSPLELARAYQRFAAEESPVSEPVREALLEALSRHSPDPARIPSGRIAWKTGTSSGRRDAWCVGVGADHVIVVWMGQLNGRGHPELVGSRQARALMSDLFVGLLRSS